MTTEQITLESLVGEHVLTGVDEGGLPADSESGRWDDASTITFLLDGIAYTAIEDPVDGYRSCMGELKVGAEVANRFTPCRVVCSMNDEILEARDVTTGKIVLEVGTGNADDYYPFFVGRFDPTGMASNNG